MSSVDEIMEAIRQAADAMDDCLDGGLRNMIAAAIADAKREGAEQMREACARACGETYSLAIAHGDVAVEIEALCYPTGMTADDIRALPLPAGQRQAVRLTDEQIDDIAHTVAQSFLGGGGNDVDNWDTELSRAIETAVLAANGLETK